MSEPNGIGLELVSHAGGNVLLMVQGDHHFLLHTITREVAQLHGKGAWRFHLGGDGFADLIDSAGVSK